MPKVCQWCSGCETTTQSTNIPGIFTSRGLKLPLSATRSTCTITKPSAEQPAAALTVPGLILTSPGDPMTLRSNAVELSRVWKTATLRSTPKVKSGGLVEGRRLAPVIGLPGADRGSQKTVRALLTGYLLYMLAGDEDYKDFADAEVELPKAAVLDPFADDPVDLENKVIALLKP